MANETYTTEQYNTLCAAIAQGVLRVKYGDKEIDYRSLNDMRQIKAMMEAVLFPGKKKTKRKYLNFKKGFN